jgi:hypothetical protein
LAYWLRLLPLALSGYGIFLWPLVVKAFSFDLVVKASSFGLVVKASFFGLKGFESLFLWPIG